MATAMGRRASRRLLSQPAVPVRLPTPFSSPVLSQSCMGFPVGAAGVGGLFFIGGLFVLHAAIVLFICPSRVLNRVQKP